LLVHFQKPEDSGFKSGLLCKVIVVASLTLSWLIVLLLPLDVRNSRPVPGIPGLMLVVWRVGFALAAAFAVIFVPAASFYDEVEDDDTVPRKCRYVLCRMASLFFFVACAVGISYPFLSDVAVPVEQYSCDAWLDAGDLDGSDIKLCKASVPAHIRAKADVEVYLIALLCFAGWLLLSVFGGIGLVSAPLDLVMAFVDRPRPVDERTYQQRRQLLGSAAQAMLRHSEALQQQDADLAEQTGWSARRRRRHLGTEYNKFKRDIRLLEDEFERLRISKFERGENLAVSCTKLALGVTFAIISLAWVSHIALYVLIAPRGKPASVWLNWLLELFEHPGLYPIGVAIFACFSLYLLLCVVAGCLKFGMRFFCVFSIHPMRYKETPLSSVLFNVELVLVSSVAVAQFVQEAFADYTRLTDADALFHAQIRYLKCFGWFFKTNFFVYLLVGVALVALGYLTGRPRDRGEVGLDQKSAERLEAIAEGSVEKGSSSSGRHWPWGSKRRMSRAEGAEVAAAAPAAPRAGVIAAPAGSMV